MHKSKGRYQKETSISKGWKVFYNTINNTLILHKCPLIFYITAWTENNWIYIQDCDNVLVDGFDDVFKVEVTRM